MRAKRERPNASRVEIWIASVHIPGRAQDDARRAEQDGFDGLSFGDTQGLAADPYVGLALAARVTERLRLGVRVTNPVTRHPAVTASAIATVQVESRGRAVLGIGRGDSALTNIGLAPASLRRLETYVEAVQRYLRGESIEIDGWLSRIEWLGAAAQPKVPLDVAATGPGVASIGARLAERLTFNVGANVERLSHAVAAARRVRAEAGLDPGALALGAYVNVAPHPDRSVARDLARGPAAAYARFSGMGNISDAGIDPADRRVFDALREHYDPREHGRGTAAHVRFLDDAFMDRFAVVGPPDHCVGRLDALLRCGLQHLVIVGPLHDGDPEGVARSSQLLAREVIPRLRANAASRGGAEIRGA